MNRLRVSDDSNCQSGYEPLRLGGKLELSVPQVFNAPDYTYFIDTAKVRNVLLGVEDHWHSIECTVFVKSVNSDGSLTAGIEGRGNVAKCHNGRFCAVTIRKIGKPVGNPAKPPAWADGNWDRAKGWYPPALDASGLYAIGLDTTTEKLRGELGENAHTGLIVVSGTTNCAKSLITTGLVMKLLEGRSWPRRPHILTIEDPVERLLTSVEPDDPSLGVDYSLRQLGVDCPSIEAGLKDARRQTPAVVFVGEVRDRADWRAILDFAGSGHLIVTTTHAGSLIECLQQLMSAVNAKSAAEIGAIAERILAAIHLRQFHKSDQSRLAILPAMWRRTTASIAQMVGDGMSSVLPCHPAEGVHTVGRVGFCNKLNLQKEDLVWLLPLAYEADVEGR